MNTVNAFLNLSDQIYCGYLGIDTRGGDLAEWREKYGKNKLSIAKQLEVEDPDTEARFLGGKNKSPGGAKTICRPREARKIHFMDVRSSGTGGVSRAAKVREWVAQMEEQGLYRREKISELLNVSVDIVDYAIEKGRLPTTFMKCKSSTIPIGLVRLEDANAWLTLDKQYRAGNIPDLPEWKKKSYGNRMKEIK
jgi:hypothetical protein